MSEPHTIETNTIRLTDLICEPRCDGQHQGKPCRKKLAERVASGTTIRCSRCGRVNRW